MKTDVNQLLGPAILGLVKVIEQKIRQENKSGLDPNAHCSYAATIVSALAKSEDNYKLLMKNPPKYSIPLFLQSVIEEYITTKPALLTLSKYPEFASRSKRQLIQGDLAEFQVRPASMTEEKPSGPPGGLSFDTPDDEGAPGGPASGNQNQ